MNRRQVLVRGTAVAGAAWAAPTLMSSPAYAFGASGCVGQVGKKVCGPADEQQACCNTADTCTDSRATATGAFVAGCAPAGQPGGACATTANCPADYECSNGICGGRGASCQGSRLCGPGYVRSVDNNGGTCVCREQCSTAAGTTHTCSAGSCSQTHPGSQGLFCSA